MSSAVFGIICGACITVFALIAMRLLTGEWIWETHNKEGGDK